MNTEPEADGFVLSVLSFHTAYVLPGEKPVVFFTFGPLCVIWFSFFPATCKIFLFASGFHLSAVV